ncbi:RusA family crossover junction endodeoxyribonuclease [Paraburkholderia sp. BL17N1]|uniref:RusA family crossover junction endodeoxyribonuclease n=1 Tax=Paraburkholderia sp. BL17N1 TaxID=1938798 RepID=UPI000EAF377C|nr:RusA family crossover junction endodeoxyribonuclease [Paraburkholderia sp. BL17N1]RKR46287.1 Holliday junction resolvase RusA-like endonuclease [Paraburkholderia sp. BL17N1]
MNQIIFSVPGTPVAKGRAKFARRGNFVTAYTPKETVQYENLVRLAAQEAMAGADPFDRPIALTVAIYLPIPQSWSKKKQEKARTGAVGATKKPDADNVLKALKDGMNGVVYVDDARITDVVLQKRYALSPRVDVIARALDLEVA